MCINPYTSILANLESYIHTVTQEHICIYTQTYLESNVHTSVTVNFKVVLEAS